MERYRLHVCSEGERQQLEVGRWVGYDMGLPLRPKFRSGFTPRKTNRDSRAQRAPPLLMEQGGQPKV